MQTTTETALFRVSSLDEPRTTVTDPARAERDQEERRSHACMLASHPAEQPRRPVTTMLMRDGDTQSRGFACGYCSKNWTIDGLVPLDPNDLQQVATDVFPTSPAAPTAPAPSDDVEADAGSNGRPRTAAR